MFTLDLLASCLIYTPLLTLDLLASGSIVIESKAYPWYGILGNMKGHGRPFRISSTAPITCLPGSKAAVCQPISDSSCRTALVSGTLCPTSGGSHPGSGMASFLIAFLVNSPHSPQRTSLSLMASLGRDLKASLAGVTVCYGLICCCPCSSHSA